MAVITVNPGDDWGTKYSGGNPGDTYTIKAGVHRGQTMTVSRNGDTIEFETDARATGGRLLTTWTLGTGAEYYVTGETTGPTADASGMKAGWEANDYEEDLFVDDAPYKQMEEASIGSLNAGEWAWDDTNDRIYVRLIDDGDPDDVTVEITDTDNCLDIAGDNTTLTWVDKPATDSPGWSLRRFQMPIIEKYAPASKSTGGMIKNDGEGTVIEWLQIRHCHGNGIKNGGVDLTVKHCRVVWNGHKGLGGTWGGSYTIENCEVAYNNYNHFDNSDQGNLKLSSTRTGNYGLPATWPITNTVRGNWIHHGIVSSGLWCDIDCGYELIEYNIIEYNEKRGIHYEISSGPAIIRYNLIRYNGEVEDSPGFLLASSSNVEFYDNVVIFRTAAAGGINNIRGNSGGLARATTNVEAITAITKANPAVCATAVEHKFETGEVIRFESVSGMTELMNDPEADSAKRYHITRISTTQFSLDGVDSTSFGTYSSSTYRRERRSYNNDIHDNIVVNEDGVSYAIRMVDNVTTRIDADDDAESLAALNVFTNNLTHAGTGGTGQNDYVHGSAVTLTNFEVNGGANATGNTETADAYTPPQPALVTA